MFRPPRRLRRLPFGKREGDFRPSHPLSAILEGQAIDHLTLMIRTHKELWAPANMAFEHPHPCMATNFNNIRRSFVIVCVLSSTLFLQALCVSALPIIHHARAVESSQQYYRRDSLYTTASRRGMSKQVVKGVCILMSASTIFSIGLVCILIYL